MKNNLIIINSSPYEDIVKKGVSHTYEDYLEGGYFNHIHFICPFSRKSNSNRYSENITVSQYGWETGITLFDNIPYIKYLLALKCLFFGLSNTLKIINLEKPSVIRSTDPYLLGFFGFLISKLTNKKFVVSVHADYDIGSELNGFTFKLFGSRWIAKILEKFILSHADAIFPIRMHLKNKILSSQPELACKIAVFNHSIDLVNFDNIKYISIKDLFLIPAEKKIISFAGRLSNENFIFDHLELLKRIIATRDDVMLVMIGSGELYDELVGWVDSSDLKKFVVLAGFQPNEVVINLRKQSNISLCLMGGYSLLEACAAKSPVVTYDVDWHGELIENDKTGFIFRMGDVDGMANAVNEILEKPAVAKILAANSRLRVVENYSREVVVKKKVFAYNQIINSGSENI
ncbi:glycosyltransferase family 4 protein [Polynucleobacter difficilis]|uniref:glycosyltransferase family 4 protein n=1 Tax=Polynucleobacter difficilis TaxID=556054 RepID=UPI000D3466EE|nr:glycosyltransferase family 4 protein [Polynucleobacter difficilis]